MLLSAGNVYLTASKEEAGANHVLEAMAAGLPVLYHANGGSIINYCKNYGLEYDSYNTLLVQLENVYKNYKLYKERVLQYNCTIDETVGEYMKIICNIK